jgi:hypothetical protein
MNLCEQSLASLQLGRCCYPTLFRDPVLQALMIFDVQAKSLKNYLYLLQVLRWVAV